MTRKAILGMVLACTACCAVPLIIPAAAGISVFGWQLRGPLNLEAILCAAASATLAFLMAYLVIRYFNKRKRKVLLTEKACQAHGKCGCK